MLKATYSKEDLQKLALLLAREKQRVRELAEKVQAAQSRDSDEEERIRILEEEQALYEEQIEQLLSQQNLLEEKLTDFEALEASLARVQGECERIHRENIELTSKLQDARTYGEELQQKFQEREKEINRFEGIEEENQALTKQAEEVAANMVLIEEAKVLHQEGVRLCGEAKEQEAKLEEAQHHLAKRLKQVTLLQASLDHQNTKIEELETKVEEGRRLKIQLEEAQTWKPKHEELARKLEESEKRRHQLEAIVSTISKTVQSS